MVRKFTGESDGDTALPPSLSPDVGGFSQCSEACASHHASSVLQEDESCSSVLTNTGLPVHHLSVLVTTPGLRDGVWASCDSGGRILSVLSSIRCKGRPVYVNTQCSGWHTLVSPRTISVWRNTSRYEGHVSAQRRLGTRGDGHRGRYYQPSPLVPCLLSAHRSYEMRVWGPRLR